jgi:hypothetical protein
LNSRVRDHSRTSGSSCCSLGQSSAVTIVLARDTRFKVNCHMLGHATIVLKLDIYSYVIPAMHGDAAAAMDAALGS